MAYAPAAPCVALAEHSSSASLRGAGSVGAGGERGAL